MASKIKELILLTAGFPFGKEETFLETELLYLADAYKQVRIIAVNPISTKARSIPSNCIVERLNVPLHANNKIQALSFLCDKTIREELKIIRKVYKKQVTKGILSTLLISRYRANCIKKYLQKKSYINAVTFYSYWFDDSALALALLKKEDQSVKVVSRAHGWDVYFDIHPLSYLPFRTFTVKQLDAVFPISDKGKTTIKNTWKISETSNIRVSRLGVTPQENSAKVESQLLVSCSNLIPLKRVELIIEGIKNLTFPLKWVHFGDGPEMDRLKKRASDLPETVTVEWKGRLSNTDVMDFYKTEKPTAFINVSVSEGIPVSIMEAMSFGIPCIASDVGGNSEVVSNTNGVLLAENICPEEIARAITSIFCPQTFPKKSEAAYNTWLKNYNATINYPRFAEVLKHIS